MHPDGPLSPERLARMDAYWRAADYLTVGQIYLKTNPLLREPLKRSDVKSRLLGHFGTTTGLNFLYTHLNRLIVDNDLDMIFVAGPGHGGPGLVAQSWLEGTWTERYPDVDHSAAGMERLMRQFSWPYGVPSHVAPVVPGSIHEGGELGYSLVHAFGAAFDNPDLIVACVVGDGEAETGPLATSWHSNKFLNPARDGAVLPILHLNGWKIANPTVLARLPRDELEQLAHRLWLGADPGAGRRSGRGAPGAGRRPGRSPGPHPPDPVDGAGRGGRGDGAAAPLADDRLRHAQGLERPEGDRRRAGGGHLARPPGADGERRSAGSSRDSGDLAQELSARGAVRRLRRAGGEPAARSRRKASAG